MNAPHDLVLFVGRFHPVLVHLPIGFIMLLVFLELLARVPRFSGARASAGYVVALAVPAAGASAVCGWMLSLGGGYDERLLAIHWWGGWITTFLCALTAVFLWSGLRKAYQFCLFMTALALIVAAHFGGSLTHGSGYLLRYAPDPIRSLLNRGASSAPDPGIASTELPVENVIRSLLERRCTSCHNPEKRKGGLLLDTLEGLRRGGDSGPAMVPGQAADSPMIARMLLPLAHDDHMPPEGKPQPTPEEIALLRWWVGAGAPAGQPIKSLNPPPEILRAAETPAQGAK